MADSKVARKPSHVSENTLLRVLSKITQTIRRMRKDIPRCLLGDLLGVNVGRYRFDFRRTRAKESVFCTFYFEFSVHFLF